MAYTGGCQCGKIRFHCNAPADHASVCYCRMCQKASGAPFMAFVSFPAAQVQWTIPPQIFASSNQIERGFCANCGTPLTYRENTSQLISITINSLDDPESARPLVRFEANSEVSWCRTLANLPAKEFDLTTSPDFINYQHRDSP